MAIFKNNVQSQVLNGMVIDFTIQGKVEIDNVKLEQTSWAFCVVLEHSV